MQQIFLGLGAASTKTYVDDVFSTEAYIGNDSTTTVTNNIDNSTEGGMVWLKSRSQAYDNYIFDTVRGVSNPLSSNTAAAQQSSITGVSAFNTNGYTIGGSGYTNGNAITYGGWNFRKAKGFFDIVTYTGNGEVSQTLSHSLGSIPGLILIKCTTLGNVSGVGDSAWRVYHRSTGNTHALGLNQSNAAVSNSAFWNNTDPTSTQFTIGSSLYMNYTGESYVAYLFAGGDVASGTSADIDITSKTVTNLGGTFDSTHTMAKMTDGVLETSNAQNMAYVNAAANPSNPDMDVYVDLDTPHVVTKYRIGPQGGNGTSGYNLVNDFNVYGTNDTSSWNFVAAFSPGQSNWTGGAYRDFEFGNEISYRYWRIQVTQGDSGNNKSISEWKIEGYSAAVDTSSYVFGENGDKNIISCGSYIGNGSNDGPQINCGWEPQYVLVKNATSNGDWRLFDSMRGIGTGTDDAYLGPNQDGAENDSSDYFHLTSTGFKMTNTYQNFNTDGDTFLYMTIRRPDGYVGKPPSAGTDVFAMDAGAGSSTIPNFDSTFPVDFGLVKLVNAEENWYACNRLIRKSFVQTSNNGTRGALASATFDSSVGWAKEGSWSTNHQSWMWKRGQGFDVVAYSGNGVDGRNLNHSLNQAPQMIWIKNGTDSGNTGDWMVGHKDLNGGSSPWNYYLVLNKDQGEYSDSNPFNNSAPTSTTFQLDSWDRVNASGSDYVAMLFASANDADGNPISKVGSYTGNGSNTERTITLGLQPRFIIIKNISSSNNWEVLDTTRGWGSGNDSRIWLDGEWAEDTGNNIGAPTSTGFTLTTDTAGLNSNSNTYIYYAHA